MERDSSRFSFTDIRATGGQSCSSSDASLVSRELVPEAIAVDLRVVDLSGAWRLKQAENRAIYEFQGWQCREGRGADRGAVYGLPELNGEQIRPAALVANPGCYATSVILALAPLLSAGIVDRDRGIISDSKSGVSGAGKEPTPRTHFVSVADNFSAYSVFGHRHTGEILEQLGLDSGELIFTPHLLPIPRGILSTIYVHLKREMKAEEIQSCSARLLYRASAGCEFSRRRVCRRSSFPCTQITATSVSLLARDRTQAGAGFLSRQSAQRRSRTGRAEHEPDVRLG